MLLRIKEIRTQKGISQLALADALNVNQTAVSQWEREATLPSCDRLPDIAHALGVPIGDLFTERGKTIPSQ